MVFNDSANKEVSLYHDVLFKAGLNTVDFAVDPDYTRITNKKLRLVAAWLWMKSSSWRPDDPNLVSGSIESWTRNVTEMSYTRDLSAGTENYALPTEVFSIDKVEVKDNSGDFQVVRSILKESISVAVSEFEEDDALPIYWYIDAGNLILKPAPASGSVTTSGGLKIHVNHRDIKQFETTDTTVEIGIPDVFEDLLGDLIALEVADKESTVRIQRLKENIASYGFDLNLSKVATRRNSSRRPRVSPHSVRRI